MGPPAVDLAVRADWIDDNRTDIAAFRPAGEQWFVRGATTVAYGGLGEVPV